MRQSNEWLDARCEGACEVSGVKLPSKKMTDGRDCERGSNV